MAVYIKIKKSFYQDSLKLMQISAEVAKRPHIDSAFAFMATDINKKTRLGGNLITDEVANASPDDLVLLIESDKEMLGREALSEFETLITTTKKATPSNNGEAEATPTTFQQGKVHVHANLAIISVPGIYATVQTLLAIDAGMNVMLFSDNVSVEDEIMIKKYAKERNLLAMGPDCGTAIIADVPLCFANVIKKGDVGVIGASGTGTQEFAVLLEEAGCGISHAIGVGGRDLSVDVAGLSTFTAIDLLANDNTTNVLTIVSKPPAPEMAEKVIEYVKKTNKPAVFAFLGMKSKKVTDNLHIAGTIEEAVAKAAALSLKNSADDATVVFTRETHEDIFAMAKELDATQKRVVGLFTGGTLASEANYILRDIDAQIIDLGDDEYTRGALHPMIDPSNRAKFVENFMNDPEIAILFCDVVLGYGSHPDPAGALVEAISDARAKTSSKALVIASVTGTDADPQNKTASEKALKDNGILVFPSNQYAAEIVEKIVKSL